MIPPWVFSSASTFLITTLGFDFLDYDSGSKGFNSKTHFNYLPIYVMYLLTLSVSTHFFRVLTTVFILCPMRRNVKRVFVNIG